MNDPQFNKSAPPPVITWLAEELANQVLRMDPEVLDQLAELDGKVIAVQYRDEHGNELTRYILPFGGGLRIRREHEGIADVTIGGNLPVFLQMLFKDAMPQSIVNADMQIRGDIDLGQRFKKILEGLEPDFEEALSRHVGDMAAHRIGRLFKGWQDFKKRAVSKFEQDVAEYSQEEARITPHKFEVDSFLDAVDDMRDRIDRLEQRIRNMKGRA